MIKALRYKRFLILRLMDSPAKMSNYSILCSQFTVDRVCSIFTLSELHIYNHLDYTSNSYVYPFGQCNNDMSNNKRLA